MCFPGPLLLLRQRARQSLSVVEWAEKHHLARRIGVVFVVRDDVVVVVDRHAAYAAAISRLAPQLSLDGRGSSWPGQLCHLDDLADRIRASSSRSRLDPGL